MEPEKIKLYRFDEAGPRVSAAMLGVAVACLLQMASREHPDEVATSIFAGSIPILLALFGVSTDQLSHLELQFRHTKRYIWHWTLMACGLVMAYGLYRFVAPIGSAGVVLAISSAVSLFFFVGMQPNLD